VKTYQWIDQENDIVAVIDEDGKCRVTGLAADLVPEGAEVLPQDAPKSW